MREDHLYTIFKLYTDFFVGRGRVRSFDNRDFKTILMEIDFLLYFFFNI